MRNIRLIMPGFLDRLVISVFLCWFVEQLSPSVPISCPAMVVLTKFYHVTSLSIIGDILAKNYSEKHLNGVSLNSCRYEAMPFHPYYLKSLERYSVLRFMDMQKTNSRADVHWADRPHLEDRTYQAGVPLEHMILLSNVLGADPWFCMPHSANDDYVRQFAVLVLQTLRPDVTVYIEYSNEVFLQKFLSYIP